MKQDRMQKSEYLFREIGNIHDRWVTEALTYQPKCAALPRVMPIAAAIALTASLLVATVLVGLHRSAPNGNNIGSGNGGSVGNDSAESAQFTLDELLLEHRTTQTASYTVLASPAEVNFFSSNVQVAWQYADSSAVYVSRALTQKELQSLEKSLEGSTNATSNEQPSCMVWILYGDGRVVSPYLHPSIGNTGESELFDYHIEVIPNADFSSCLSEILK